MLKEAFEWIANHNQKKIIKDASGRQYWSCGSKVVPPGIDFQQFQTLTGLLGYTIHYMSKFDRRDVFFKIVKGTEVCLYDRNHDDCDRGSSVAGSATPVIAHCGPLNVFVPHDEFMILLQTVFYDTPERQKLLSFVSKIKGSEVTTVDDDGIAQNVAVSSGFNRLADQVAPQFVDLVRQQTFAEVEQPSAKYLLRLRKSSRGLPEIALFETRDPAVELEAMSRVAEYMSRELAQTDLLIPIIK